MNKRFAVLFSVCVLLLTLGTIACSRSRSDAQITTDVQAMLKADSTLASKQITVQTDAGTVSLSGNVSSEAERSAAEKAANQAVGVKRVINNLQVIAAAAPPAASPEPSAHAQKLAPVQTAKPKRAVATAAQKAATTTQGTTAVPTPAPTPVIIPVGTAVSVRLIDPVDTTKNKEGDTFRASLESPILVDGKTIVPKNADVEARLLSAKSAGHFTGSSSVVS